MRFQVLIGRPDKPVPPSTPVAFGGPGHVIRAMRAAVAAANEIHPREFTLFNCRLKMLPDA